MKVHRNCGQHGWKIQLQASGNAQVAVFLPPAKEIIMHALYYAAADNSNTITLNHLRAVLAFHDDCQRNNIVLP
jgi:hypothetical protein